MNPRAVIVALAAALAAAGSARLGVWQLDRAAQKTAMQAQIDARAALPPLPAAELARQLPQRASQLHRQVRLEGEWLDAFTVYLDNRQSEGRPGFIVLTPLRLADGDAVLVQRGWVARDFLDRMRLPALPAEPGLVSVQGRIAADPARLFEFADAASGPIRQNVALDDFARETGLSLRPVSLLQTGPASSSLRRDWPRPVADVHKNYGYAFQWFALSALIACLYVWFQIIRPRRRAAA